MNKYVNAIRDTGEDALILRCLAVSDKIAGRRKIHPDVLKKYIQHYEDNE